MFQSIGSDPAFQGNREHEEELPPPLCKNTQCFKWGLTKAKLNVIVTSLIWNLSTVKHHQILGPQCPLSKQALRATRSPHFNPHFSYKCSPLLIPECVYLFGICIPLLVHRLKKYSTCSYRTSFHIYQWHARSSSAYICTFHFSPSTGAGLYI